MLGIAGVIVALLWLIAAGSEDDGGPDVGLFYLFGIGYFALRVCRQLINDPVSIQPAFGILAMSAGLIEAGNSML